MSTHAHVAARLGAHGMTTTITAGDHQFIADEPTSLGGDDKGPTPYELFLGSLAACKTITLRMYAQHKGWPLEEVIVTASHGRIHANDCADCDAKSGMVDRIDVTLQIKGDLTDEQRERLHQIADRCPVHQTLITETVIKTAHEEST